MRTYTDIIHRLHLQRHIYLFYYRIKYSLRILFGLLYTSSGVVSFFIANFFFCYPLMLTSSFCIIIIIIVIVTVFLVSALLIIIVIWLLGQLLVLILPHFTWKYNTKTKKPVNTETIFAQVLIFLNHLMSFLILIIRSSIK